MLHLAARPWHVVSNAFSRLVSSTRILCRVGALLALLQLIAWIGTTTPSSVSASAHHERTQQQMAAVDSVLDPTIAGFVRNAPFETATVKSDSERLLCAARALSRTLLWGVVIVLLPMTVITSFLAVFVRKADTQRMFVGMLAVLGLLPLAAAETVPELGVNLYEQPMPASMLAGVAAPLVAGILLISAAVLFSPQGPVARASAGGEADHISRNDLETIIRRGARPTPKNGPGVRSSRSRRRML